MTVLISKWTIAIAVLLVMLLILSVYGRKSVHTELIIESNPHQVWNILLDEKNYPKWNNVLIPVKGKIKQGNRLTYKLVQPKGKPIEITLKVKKLVPLQLLNQSGGIPGIFTYDHYYILKREDRYTKVIIHEDFNGIAVHFMDLDWIQQAYSDLNKSLRAHTLEIIH